MQVMTFGEIMLRLSTVGYSRFIQSDKFNVNYGGAEANVAVGLSNLGVSAGFVTKLPDNFIGAAAVCSLKKFGVNTDFIVKGGNRLGVYYLEKGASLRPSNVAYDREFSSFALSTSSDYDWNKILNGAEWFHLSGITPSLSGGITDICLKALQAAKSKGIKISFDLNYRAKLWSKNKAAKIIADLMPFVNLFVSNEWQAQDLFGLNSIDSFDIAQKLHKKFGTEKIALTKRVNISCDENIWSATLYDGSFYRSKEYNVKIIDRVGGGDSFVSGLLYSFLNGFDNAQSLEFAVATSALKLTVEGDYSLFSAGEVLELVNGDGLGYVKR